MTFNRLEPTDKRMRQKNYFKISVFYPQIILIFSL